MQKRIKVWNGSRILYYAQKTDPGFWDEHWNTVLTPDYYQRYLDGNLDELSPFIEKLIPKDSKVIEAGCGPARMVVALKNLGYNHVEGIDYGIETVKQVNILFPNLPVKVGDVLAVDKPDGFYDAYISLGVVEHRYEGPEPFLQEAHRILKTGGHAFITVPYINPLRHLKCRLRFYNSSLPEGSFFYQYAFSIDEFSETLKKARFSLLSVQSFAGLYGLREEMPVFFHLLDRIRGGTRLQKLLNGKAQIEKFGHMVLFVCRKNN